MTCLRSLMIRRRGQNCSSWQSLGCPISGFEVGACWHGKVY